MKEGKKNFKEGTFSKIIRNHRGVGKPEEEEPEIPLSNYSYTKEDECGDAEYKNIDKIGFGIRIDSNAAVLLMQFEPKDIQRATQAYGRLSYTLESAGIRFPLSEESGKAIVEKWICLMEHMKEKNGNKNK